MITNSLNLHQFYKNINSVFKEVEPTKSKIQEKIELLFLAFIEDTKGLDNQDELVSEAKEYKDDILEDLENLIKKKCTNQTTLSNQNKV